MMINLDESAMKQMIFNWLREREVPQESIAVVCHVLDQDPLTAYEFAHGRMLLVFRKGRRGMEFLARKA